MNMPESEFILRDLRKLEAEMNPADPDPIQIRKFRDLFLELDVLLKSGATFPTSWITRANYTHLPSEITHTITDFDPPNDEQLRKRGLAWCGHTMASTTQYCRNPQCGNYVHYHGANF